MVLWCDGGEGGVSGVAGRGMHAFRQVGPRSWAQTVSIPWPYDRTRTVFSAAGTWVAVVVVWAIAGLGWVAGRVANDDLGGVREGGAGRAWELWMMRIHEVLSRSFGWRERRGEDSEEQPLLG